MNKKNLKSMIKNAMQLLGNKTPWLVRLILNFFYPIPRLYILVAHMTKIYQPVRQRQWNIKSGPLRGMKLVGLLPAEILPVLTNSMERKNCDLLRIFSLEQGIALDVGGSYGYYALLLSRLIEQVYSFEPDWHSFGRLTRNLDLNEVKNAIAISICVSNSSTGFVKWQSFENEPWNSRLVDDTSYSSDSLTVIPVITLDEFVNRLEIAERIRLLKIDVEGAELRVLQGAEKIITEVKPLILCELHGEDIAKQVFEFLDSVDYKWAMIEYVDDTRQHIFAFPSDQFPIYQSLISS